MVAGSHDCYKAFQKLFNPIIEEYHLHDPEDKHPVEPMDPELIDFNPIFDKPIVVSSRIRVIRNFEGYNLSPGCNKK